MHVDITIAVSAVEQVWYLLFYARADPKEFEALRTSLEATAAHH